LDSSDLKRGITVLRIERKIIFRYKWNFFIRRLGTQDVTKRDILESFRLTHVVKVGNVDTVIVSQDSYGGFYVTYPAGIPDPAPGRSYQNSSRNNA
jgi:hypothetical protein